MIACVCAAGRAPQTASLAFGVYCCVHHTPMPVPDLAAAGLLLCGRAAVATTAAAPVVAAPLSEVQQQPQQAAPAASAAAAPPAPPAEQQQQQMVKLLRLRSAAAYLPHPDKESYGGEDAHFVSNLAGGAIGVADGALRCVWCC
jgi:hypothetical protein